MEKAFQCIEVNDQWPEGIAEAMQFSIVSFDKRKDQ